MIIPPPKAGDSMGLRKRTLSLSAPDVMFGEELGFPFLFLQGVGITFESFKIHLQFFS